MIDPAVAQRARDAVPGLCRMLEYAAAIKAHFQDGPPPPAGPCHQGRGTVVASWRIVCRERELAEPAVGPALEALTPPPTPEKIVVAEPVATGPPSSSGT